MGEDVMIPPLTIQPLVENSIQHGLKDRVSGGKVDIPVSYTHLDVYKRQAQGRLLCGAAVGITANVLERVGALVDAKVDVVVLDSAHGHSANVIRCVKMIKDAYPCLLYPSRCV